MDQTWIAAPGAALATTGGALVLKAGASFLELEGESVAAVRAVMAALQEPTTESALRARLGDDAVDEVLEFLVENGAVAPASPSRPAEARLAAAVASGVAIVSGRGGAARLADAIAAHLGRAQVQVARVEADAALDDQRVVVGVHHLLDPGASALVRRARAARAPSFPVLLNGRYAYAGPPARDGGPCARCLSMRLLAHESALFHSIWSRFDKEGADVACAPLQDEAAAAAAVVGVLLSVDATGRTAGVEDAVVRIDVATGLAEPHPLLRHGHCDACGARPPRARVVDEGELARQRDAVAARWRRIMADDPESMRPEDSIARLYQDPVVGLNMYAEDWSQAAHYFKQMPECWGGIALVREHEYLSTPLQGINGTGATLDLVRLVSFSEGLERYAQYAHQPVLEDVAYRDVARFAFDPRKLTLYSEEQYRTPGFPRPRFREDAKLKWSWGCSLLSGEAKLFPAECIVVNYKDDYYPGRIIAQELTTGGASHASYARALNNAFRELIERDAFMIAWYKKMELPRVDVPSSTGNAYTDDLHRYLRERGVELTVYDLRLDFPIPTFLVIGRVTTRQGALEVGGTVGAAAADLDPAVALGRALGEMRIHYETLALTADAMKDWRNYPYDPHSPDEGFGNWWPNYVYYLNPARRGAFSFLEESTLRTSWESLRGYGSGDPVSDRDFLLRCFQQVDLEPYAWDLVIEETARSGFRIVKVEVPGIIHLVPGRQSRRLASPRFEAVARKMARRCLPEGEINADTHIQA